MSRCDHCGAEIAGAARFRCNFCEEDLCAEHRLPESHDCVHIDQASSPGLDLERAWGRLIGDAEEAASSAGGEADSSGRDVASTCDRCGNPAPHRLDYCNDCRAEKINERGGSVSAEKTPCEDCGRPCPADQELCSPCQKDRAGLETTATREEIAEHWQAADDRQVQPDPGGRELPSVSRRSVLAGVGLAAVGGGYARREDVGSLLSGVLGWFDNLDDFDPDAAALEIHRLVNEDREQEGLATLDYSHDLEDDALAHSVDMAANDYFGHGDSQGRSLRERVDVACGTIAENVAQSWVFRDVETAAGEEYIGDETDLAENVVRGWMLSPGHRENILTPGLLSEGIGVHRAEGNEVFVTQLFCG